MSLTATIAAATIKAEDEFHAPSAGLFDLPSIADSGITKSMILVSFSALLILGFTILSSRNIAMRFCSNRPSIGMPTRGITASRSGTSLSK